MDVGCTEWVSDATNDDGETLDVMISRTDGGQLDVKVIDIGLSDHRLIRTTIDFNPPQPEYETITSRAWRKFNIDAFRSDIRTSVMCDDSAWSNCIDPAQLLDCCNSTLAALIDKHAQSPAQRAANKGQTFFTMNAETKRR